MPPSSATVNYDAVASACLNNIRPELEDQISKSNALFFELKKTDAWEGTSDLGNQCQVTLMYGLGQTDAYSGYDVLNVDPIDGITAGLWDYGQCATPIAISRIEERKNAGSEVRIFNLLEGKTRQAVLGIQDFFSKAVMQGNGINSATAVTTAYASPTNGASFVDPLGKLVRYDATTSAVIGNINQSTYSWWQNQYKASGGATFAAILADLDNCYNNCSKGPGGSPNFHICDQSTFELYQKCLWAKHQNPSYSAASYPFETLNFHGKPLFWDENIIDASGASTTQSTTSGTWYMLNTRFMKMVYDNETNFITTEFKKPIDQDAKVAHILWYGAFVVSNRRKQGVAGSIDTTVTS
jgi:hypothetical protein